MTDPTPEQLAEDLRFLSAEQRTKRAVQVLRRTADLIENMRNELRNAADAENYAKSLERQVVSLSKRVAELEGERDQWLDADAAHVYERDQARDERDAEHNRAVVAEARLVELENERDQWSANAILVDAESRAAKAIIQRDAARSESRALEAEVLNQNDWQNELAARLPEEYDGDEAQEAIIDRFVTDALRWRAESRAQAESLREIREWMIVNGHRDMPAGLRTIVNAAPITSGGRVRRR